MAQGVGLSLDLSAIKQADKAMQDFVKKAETGIGKINAAWKNMTKDGLNHFIQRLDVAQKHLTKLGQTKVNIRLTNQSNDMQKLANSASKALNQVNQLLAAMQRLSRVTINAFGSGGASATAMDAQKIRYLEEQVRLLQQQLQVQQQIGQAVGAQVNNTNNAKNSMNKLGDAARKVRQIAGTIFSVQALMGYGNKLIQIRGEFEMQHRSLQVLLQDVDKANELWDKTVALAVKSPFRVKDLVKYTKQLAAYRVEADKLYETNKMLADVSAGLGVDMNRLILAFGQVKAANFLRGTELRQFSEAGVNMLEELAKRFTELEGRAVSVGDVFERVSKRMVTFADVEAVFKTITGEGGVFYRMQEKQSETLKGMILNLKDSVDLMFNDIGMSNDGILKKSVNIVKEIISNWRKLKPVIESAGIALMTYFGAKALSGIVKGIEAIAAAFVTHPLLATLAVLTSIAVVIWRCKKNADALTASLNQVNIDTTKQLEESIQLYHKLGDTIKDVTATAEERDKALKQLQSSFDDILPNDMLEAEFIRDKATAYDEATEAMMNYYNAKAIEQKKDRVESQFSKELDEVDTPELIASIRKRVEASGTLSKREKIRVSSGIAGIVNEVVEEAKRGDIALTGDMYENAKTLEEEIQKRLIEYAEISKDFKLNIKDWWGFQQNWVDEDLRDLARTLGRYNEAMSNIEGLPARTASEYEAAQAFLPHKESVETAIDAFKKIITEVDKYTGKSIEEMDALDEAVEAMLRRLPEGLEAYIPLLRNKFNEMKEVASEGSFAFGKNIQRFQQEFLDSLPQIMGVDIDIETNSQLTQLFDNFTETLEKQSKELNLKPFQKAVISVFEDVADETSGVDVDLFRKFIPDAKKSRGEIIKELKALEEQYTESIAAWDKSISEGVSTARAEQIHSVSEATIDQWRKDIVALAEAASRLGYIDKDKKGRSSKDIQERIKVIDDMHKKYEELIKTVGKDEAIEGAFKAYQDAFATAYDRSDVQGMTASEFVKNVLNFPDENDIVRWLEWLETTVTDKKDKVKVELAKGEYEMDATVNVKTQTDEELFKSIQDMFDKYELSLELKKLHISPEVAKSLFGAEGTTLADIRKKVEDELNSAKATKGQENRVKQLEKDLEKINDMEDKSLKERMKKYIQYSRESLGKMGEIRLEQLQTIMDINEAFESKDTDSQEVKDIKAQERLRAITKATEEANEAMAKLQWEEFRKSETFTELFSDLETVSDAVLDDVIKRLEEFKGQWKDLPIDQMKEVDALLRKARRAKDSDDNPWVNARDIRGRIAADGRTTEEAMFDSATASAEKAQLTEKLQMIDLINQKRNEGVSDEKIAIVLGETYIGLLGKEVDLVKERGDVERAIGEKQTAIDSAQDRIQDEKDLIKMYQNQEKALKEIDKMAQDLYGSFKELYESLGGEGEDAFAIFADMGMQMASTVLQTFALKAQLDAAAVSATGFGLAMNAAMGVIGWIVMGVQLLTQAITALAKIRDNQIVAQLEEQADIIERQRDLYEQIENKVEKAYNVEQLRQYNAEMKRSVELEIQALEAQIALEKSRKKADEEQIKDYEKQIAEARERLAESTKGLMEEMNGILDLSDFTSGFIDAWWDAMDEGMSGLDALGEHFEETLKEMVKKQALWRGAQNIMEQLQDAINDSLEDDYKIDGGEWDAIMDAAKKANVNLDAFLQGWYDMFGAMSDGAGGSLSALQKGIQGLSEETGQIIEAYLNSIRGYISEQVTHTKNIYRILNDAVHSDAAAIRVRMV